MGTNIIDMPAVAWYKLKYTHKPTRFTCQKYLPHVHYYIYYDVLLLQCIIYAYIEKEIYHQSSM